MAGRFQPERLDLLGLELAKRRGGLLHPIEPQQRLGRIGHVLGLTQIEIEVVRGHVPLTHLAHQHRLVLDDLMQPAMRALRIQAPRMLEEDLQPALIGVLRVIGVQRMLARSAQQRIGVLAQHRQDELLGVGL